MNASFYLSIFCVVGLVACRRDMMNQQRAKTFSESEFFKDGTNARSLPRHTVAPLIIRTFERGVRPAP